jgi:tRNA1(Val) A37 N6-methylase TrmN6
MMDFMIDTNQDLDFNRQKFDIIFSNPPFYTVKKGRVSTNQETAIAKFELKITLSGILEKVSKILSKNGNFFLILPYDRLDETIKLSKYFGYSIVKKRNILSFTGGKEERFLIQLANNMNDNISFTEETPLVIFKEKGVYTGEMRKILGMDL